MITTTGPAHSNTPTTLSHTEPPSFAVHSGMSGNGGIMWRERAKFASQELAIAHAALLEASERELIFRVVRRDVSFTEVWRCPEEYPYSVEHTVTQAGTKYWLRLDDKPFRTRAAAQERVEYYRRTYTNRPPTDFRVAYTTGAVPVQ